MLLAVRFGLKWFLPVVKRFSNVLAEVLVISVFIQLVALVSPLFFQVVIDKVLAHRALTTPEVLMIGLVIINVADSLLNWLRTYSFANATSAGNNDAFQLNGTSNTTAAGTGTHATVAGNGNSATMGTSSWASVTGNSNYDSLGSSSSLTVNGIGNYSLLGDGSAAAINGTQNTTSYNASGQSENLTINGNSNYAGIGNYSNIWFYGSGNQEHEQYSSVVSAGKEQLRVSRFGLSPGGVVQYNGRRKPRFCRSLQPGGQ